MLIRRRDLDVLAAALEARFEARLGRLEEQIERLSAGTAVGTPRLQPELNTVHRAEVLGYVSLYHPRGGAADEVRLLVGPDDPPTECVCEAGWNDNGNYFASYAGAIVRPGEYWMVESPREARESALGVGPGFRCIFTPLF